MSSKPLLVIQTGRPPERILADHGPFSAMIQRISRVPLSALEVVDVHEGGLLPAPHSVAGAVISGSAAMVSDREPWSEQTAQWIRDAFQQQVPMFGICYGHQLMAHALGGQVGYHPQGREIGTRAIHRSADTPEQPALPACFTAHLIHQQTVSQAPAQARILASNDHDAHQLLHYGADTWSTQFHPEFDAQIMLDYVNVFRERLIKESFDVEALASAVQETPRANALLADFIERRLLSAPTAAHE
ncbi:MAG: glutamine amidotransferase [Pigmentiphaga sp.]